MKTSTFRPALWFLAFAGLVSSAHAVTYTATLLQPPSYIQTQATGATGLSQVGYGYVNGGGYETHALLWSGTAASAVDLNPVGSSISSAYGASTLNQVGFAALASTGKYHAMLWSGTAASAIDLHPDGFAQTYAFGISGSSEIGYGEVNDLDGFHHALLWNGTASSAVDLNPAGVVNSEAWGVSGTKQAGFGFGPATGDVEHAFLWSAAAASAVDLHPAGYERSEAVGISGSVQVGFATPTGDYPHAFAWNSTPESAVDLNPAGFTTSYANGVSAAGKVGYASNATSTHAFIWQSSAVSAIDLQPYLSALNPALANSIAYGISENGKIVGSATDANGNTYAVLWTPVPEPGSCALIVGALVVLSIRFARRSRND